MTSNRLGNWPLSMRWVGRTIWSASSLYAAVAATVATACIIIALVIRSPLYTVLALAIIFGVLVVAARNLHLVVRLAGMEFRFNGTGIVRDKPSDASRSLPKKY